MTFFGILLIALVMSIVSLRWYNLLFSFVAMLMWIALWAYNLNNPIGGITKGSFVHEILSYGFIIMAIVIMLVYFRGRGKDSKNIVLGNNNNETSEESTEKPSTGIMGMSPDEYRAYMRGKLRSRIARK